jgi:hypothetical protein
VEKTTDMSQVTDKLDHIMLYHQLFGTKKDSYHFVMENELREYTAILLHCENLEK